MDDSGMPPPPPPPPPQKKMRSTNNRHIPAEIVEEILLNLPVKSLLRFSSASKSWNSTIFASDFRKNYRRRRAALPGRERIAGTVNSHIITSEKPSSCLISSISSSSNVDATDLECPFANNIPYEVLASCGDLWLARSYHKFKLSLQIWNPSMRSFKHVPNTTLYNMQIFGLGHECVEDDYKILKVVRSLTGEFVAEVYSLRSDSWRNIENLPTNIGENRGGCAFLSGKIHLKPEPYATPPAITCFDLLTEKFGEVALPDYSRDSSLSKMHVSVLRGMLCVSINFLEKSYCDVWVMEEYGVVGSWTKKFSIAYFNNISGSKCVFIVPLYLYENGEILVRYFDGRKVGMFVYDEEDERGRAREVFIRGRDDEKIDCRFMYVDSLVVPATWVDTKRKLPRSRRKRKI